MISDKHFGEYFFNRTLNVRGDLLESLWGVGEVKDGEWFIPRDSSGHYSERLLTGNRRGGMNYKPIRPILERDLSLDMQKFLDTLAQATCEEVRRFHTDMSERLCRDSDGHFVGCRTKMLQTRPTKHVAVLDENLAAVSFSRCVWAVMKRDPHLQELAMQHISDPLLSSICLPTPKDQITQMFLPVVLLHYMCINPKYEKIFMDLRIASSFLDLQSAYRVATNHAKRLLDYVPGVTLAGIAAQYGIPLPNRKILSLPAWFFPRHTHSSRWEELSSHENYAQGPHSVASQYIRFLLFYGDSENKTDSTEMFGSYSPIKHDRIFRYRAEKTVRAIVSRRQKEDRLARMLTNPAFAAMPMTAPLGSGFAPGEYPLYFREVAPAPMASLLFTCAVDIYHHLTAHNKPKQGPLNFNDNPESVFRDIPREDPGIQCLYATCRSLWEIREKWLSRAMRVKYISVGAFGEEKMENIPMFLLCYNSSSIIPGMLKRDEWDSYINFENHIHRELFVSPQWGQAHPSSGKNSLIELYPGAFESVNLHKTHFRKSDYMIRGGRTKNGKTLAFIHNMTIKAPLEVLADPDIFRLGQDSPFDSYPEAAFISWLTRGFPRRLVESGPAVQPEVKEYIKKFGDHPFVHILKNLQDDPLVAGPTQMGRVLDSFAYLCQYIYWNFYDILHINRINWIDSSEMVDAKDLGLVLLSPNHRDLLLKPFMTSEDSAVVARPVDALGKMLDKLTFDMGNWGRGSVIGLLPSISILSSPELWDVWHGPERSDHRGEDASLTLGETAAETFVAYGMRLSLKSKNKSQETEKTISILRDKFAPLREFLPRSLSHVSEDSAKSILSRLYGTPRRKESMETLVPGLAAKVCVSQAATDTDIFNGIDDMNVFDDPC